MKMKAAKNWRERLFIILERAEGRSRISQAYDAFMLLVIVASIVPMMFTRQYACFKTIEIVTVIIFIIDYLLRWLTADYKLKKGALSFVLYPFSFMAIIDLLSIVPAFNLVDNSFKIFRITRLLRIIRLLKIIRYTATLDILLSVLRKEHRVLASVLVIAAFYVFMSALVMFNVEPQVNPITGEPTFRTFFDALYWATVTLTTVGYGDVCPVTSIGRFVSMLSSLFGVAIIALPSGVITASYLDELRKKKNDKNSNENNEHAE